MFEYDEDLGMVSCQELDVSDATAIAELCTYLNKGWNVHVASILKHDPKAVVPYTFTGKVGEQMGRGVVLSGYKSANANYIVDIH